MDEDDTRIKHFQRVDAFLEGVLVDLVIRGVVLDFGEDKVAEQHRDSDQEGGGDDDEDVLQTTTLIPRGESIHGVCLKGTVVQP